MQRIRIIFLNDDRQLRTGWRIAAMFVLLAIVIFAVNAGWRALGLPGRRETGAWFFLLFAALISGGVLGAISFLLRYFEQQGMAAIWLPLHRRAWKDTAVGTMLGALPVCLMLALAVAAGYGTITPGEMDAPELVLALLPMLAAGYLLAAWEELACASKRVAMVVNRLPLRLECDCVWRFRPRAIGFRRKRQRFPKHTERIRLAYRR